MTVRHTLVAAAFAGRISARARRLFGSDSESDAKNAQGFPETIKLAGVPAENSADLKASYEPLIKLLEKETGSKVEFVQASDYAGVVEGMIAGNVDLAFFGPFAYVVAGVNGAKITPLGAGRSGRRARSPATSPTASPRRTTPPSTAWRTSRARRCASSIPVRPPASSTRPPG